MTTQRVVNVEDVRVPTIRKDGLTYYPIAFLEKRLLLRGKGSFLTGFSQESRVKLTVDLSEWNGGTQETNCVSKVDLIERLERTQVRRLSVEQIANQNKLHRYLKIAELDTDENEWDYYDMSWTKDYDEYTRGLIGRLINNNYNVKSRRCKDCEKILLLTDNFFHRETSNRETFSNSCVVCRGQIKYKSDNTYENYLNRTDRGAINLYLERDYLALYERHRNNSLKKLPSEFYTKEILNKVLLSLKDRALIDESNLSEKTLKGEYKIHLNKYNSSATEIYQWLYGEDFYLEKWKYPKYTFSGEILLTIELAVKIFQNYIDTHDIKIDDPFNFDYDFIIRKCYMTNLYKKEIGGVCDFFVYYWKGKYAGYQYRNIGNYYRFNEDNFLSDLKHLIEKELKLKVEKIPLYITKGILLKEYRPLYYYIRNAEKSIYYYIDKLYPNTFDELDFTIGNYRNEFDSIEEQQVDEVLREYFDNVVYNRKGDNMITLKGKVPDWLLVTEKGVWIVEYFGMYIERQIKNPIISSYIETTHEKIELYNEMSGYNFLLVYPSDIERGFLGLRDKIAEMKSEWAI